MPTLWRYLLVNYTKVLFFCVVSFVAVLLTTRLDEIARFATFGGGTSLVARFAAYQVPYILPIAIPISCLISSIILFQQMSHSLELTALRASGLGLRQITAPILIAGLFMAVANFFVVSELATRSHLATRQLETEMKTVNPMVLLQNTRLLRMRGIYANILGSTIPGEQASDVVLAMAGAKRGSMHLVLAKDIRSSAEQASGKEVSVISSTPVSDEGLFDQLIVENIQEVHTPVAEFTEALKSEGWRLSNDHLKMSLLLVRINEMMQRIRHSDDEPSQAEARHKLQGALSELSRRISVAAAAFAFTLMGCSFGMCISRRQSIRGVVYVVALAAFYLTGFFIGKDNDNKFLFSTLLYFLPVIVIVAASVLHMRRVSRGIE